MAKQDRDDVVEQGAVDGDDGDGRGAELRAGEDITQEIWERMTPLFHSSRDTFFKVMHDLGLTPPHGHAVMTLSSGSAKMRDLAEQMACDASYVTNVVDRLEELGLAKRQESAGDRRVREVVLTPEGETAATLVAGAMSRPPAALGTLSERDRVTLLRILRKLGPVEGGALWSRKSSAK